jgi:hypothetical protein
MPHLSSQVPTALTHDNAGRVHVPWHNASELEGLMQSRIAQAQAKLAKGVFPPWQACASQIETLPTAFAAIGRMYCPVLPGSASVPCSPSPNPSANAADEDTHDSFADLSLPSEALEAAMQASFTQLSQECVVNVDETCLSGIKEVRASRVFVVSATLYPSNFKHYQ